MPNKTFTQKDQHQCRKCEHKGPDNPAPIGRKRHKRAIYQHCRVHNVGMLVKKKKKRGRRVHGPLARRVARIG